MEWGNYRRLFHGGKQDFLWRVIVEVVFRETGAELWVFWGEGNSRWHDRVFIITNVTLSLQV